MLAIHRWLVPREGESQMAGHVVVSGSLVAQVEGLIARVGRQRLLELFMGAHSWDVQREPTGLTLTVDGAPLVLEGGTNGRVIPPRKLAGPGHLQPESEGSISHLFSDPASS